MDKIWDRKSYKVGGHWPLWRGWKNGRPRRPDKGRTLEKHTQIMRLKYDTLQIGYCETTTALYCDVCTMAN